MLELRNLTAGYPEKIVLTELSLRVREGQLAVIVGPNGCGKSTLLKAVTGLLQAEGSVRWKDRDIRLMRTRQRAQTVAFLPQNRPVPEITAGKLVLHGRFPWLGYPRRYRREDRDAAAAAMERLGISHLEDRFVTTLSGGERQKVYLAMLLAQQTPVILMDEPTAFLDISHKFELMEIARMLTRQGKTVVMVLHDLELAMGYADLVAVMEKGRIAQMGTPEEIFESGVLERVFRVRVGKTDIPDGGLYYFLPEKGTPE